MNGSSQPGEAQLAGAGGTQRPDVPGLRSREAVAVFHSADDLEAAIDDLLSSGFDRAELSLLASDEAVAGKLGHMYERSQDLEDEPEIPRTFYIATESVGDAEGGIIGTLVYVGAVTASGAVMVAGGPVGAAIVAAVLVGGAGGLIGATLAAMLGQRQADYLQHQLDRGGLLLWVRTRDEDHEREAVSILRRHAGDDVHVHGKREEQPA